MQEEVAQWLARARRELEACRKNLEIEEYHIVDFGVYVSPHVIGWERYATLPQRRPGYFHNLCTDAIELWRRPGTENPFRELQRALAA